MSDDEHWYPALSWSDGALRVDVESGVVWPSVTTILGEICSKPALRGWTGREAAKFALGNAATLAGMVEGDQYDDAVRLVAEASDRIAEDASETGVQVHRWLEAHLKGEHADFTDEEWDRVEPFVPTLVDFLERTRPTVVWAEATVYNLRDKYAGTSDIGLMFPFPLAVIDKAGRLLGTIPAGVLVVVDLKTGKSIWPEAYHQIIGYLECTHLDPKTGDPVVPMPRAGGGVVLHATPTGWRLHPVLPTKAMRHAWRHARVWFDTVRTHHTAAAGIGLQADGGSLLLEDLPGIPAAVVAALAWSNPPVRTLAELEVFGPEAYGAQPGIGPKRLEKARGLLALEGRSWPELAPAPARARRRKVAA